MGETLESHENKVRVLNCVTTVVSEPCGENGRVLVWAKPAVDSGRDGDVVIEDATLYPPHQPDTIDFHLSSDNLRTGSQLTPLAWLG